MGTFFNTKIIGMKRIPNISKKGNLEALRREFNAEHLGSEEKQQDRVDATDGTSEPEPDTVIPVVKKNRKKRTRRVSKNRAGKAGDN